MDFQRESYVLEILLQPHIIPRKRSAFVTPSEHRPGLPNLFSVAGHFHMSKFIAGHKCFCDVTISYCDVTNPLILTSFMR